MSAVARPKPEACDPDMALVVQSVERLNALGAYLRYASPAELPTTPRQRATAGWIEEYDLAFPDRPPVSKLFAALTTDGFGGNKRALSASVMLRYGWSSGFLIGTWLTTGAVASGTRMLLRFSPNAVLMEIAVTDCARVFDSDGADRDQMRVLLMRELAGRAAPIVEAHHRWSGFSRKALWSMVTSSWGAQFVHISEKLGAPERGLEEAAAVMKLDPEIGAASPDLYMVHADGKRGVCQMRKLCCLWFKGPRREFCASCPIIPGEDRLERNRKWIAQRGLPETDGTATMPCAKEETA